MDWEIDPIVVLRCGGISRIAFHYVPCFILVFVCFNSLPIRTQRYGLLRNP